MKQLLLILTFMFPVYGFAAQDSHALRRIHVDSYFIEVNSIEEASRVSQIAVEKARNLELPNMKEAIEANNCQNYNVIASPYLKDTYRQLGNKYVKRMNVVINVDLICY